ncbi:DUF6519 domain-containing protein [Polyangium sorediatum]|uniref:DUF6519 domain-containing protein n=1 Tax=Polyangium sorediatum TaxID=889274 RepID=A0ABT6NPQ2_9BACT|nr:DUF6519 domain-containing protein [Polyangium sorediatum]MDI1430187.1 DUF6519 domain-containing protein [Polyangium sorediatum]
MGSDIARRTYDEGRQYRRVIAQQGRAVIEADLNEAQEITTEELRKEALDFVGPVGTPDDGYKLSIQAPEEGAPQDIHIGPGTMYVGGMRVFLPSPGVFYSKQLDWLEDAPLPSMAYAQISLHLIEREVSAVEDRRLREVALGGPDTAQRTRLQQHFLRHNIPFAPTCKSAFDHMLEQFEELAGLYFDPKTMRVGSKATLAATFVPPSPPPDECSPTAQAGYLGAENQLIRVKVCSQNQILWGYDNASFLYRVTKVTIDTATDTSVLTLASSPVDAQHQPRIDQWVEVLVASADLGDDNYIAAQGGVITQVKAQYNPVDKTIKIGVALPDGYPEAITSSALFVRVWEEQLDFTPDAATPIGDTGLQVTLSAPEDFFVKGDYWMIALRPAAPTKIFPERYNEGPQPPDGPRQWICPLGVVRLTDGGLVITEDCRQHFDNLVELTRRRGGCCTVTVKPEDVEGGAGLQELIDGFIPTLDSGVAVRLCLLPGVYVLNAPLRLGSDHAGLTIEGCIKNSAVLRANTSFQHDFVDGLVVLVDTSSVTLRGLSFILPRVHFEGAGASFGYFTPSSLYTAAAEDGEEIDLRTLQVAVGVRLVSSNGIESKNITIRDCVFQYNEIYVAEEDFAFAAGLFVTGNVRGLEVQDNRFIRDVPPAGAFKKYYYGCLHAPATTIEDYTPPSPERSEPATADVWSLPARLDDAVVRGNAFKGLTAAAAVFHGDNRRIRVEANRVDACGSGVLLLSTDAWFVSDSALSAREETIDSHIDGASAATAISRLQNLRRNLALDEGGAIARAYPLPSGAIPPTSTEIMGPLPFTSLRELLVYVEDTTLEEVTQGRLVLHVSGNEIESDSDSGAALLVWAPPPEPSEPPEPAGEVFIGMNRMTCDTRTAVVMLFQVGRATVQGNIMRNGTSAGSGLSLVMLPESEEQRRAAITGNVFRLASVLPKRETFAGTYFPWQFFNHEEVPPPV